jgi:hypothetical protein
MHEVEVQGSLLNKDQASVLVSDKNSFQKYCTNIAARMPMNMVARLSE